MLSAEFAGLWIQDTLRQKFFAVSVQNILKRRGSGFMETYVQEKLCQDEYLTLGLEGKLWAVYQGPELRDSKFSGSFDSNTARKGIRGIQEEQAQIRASGVGRDRDTLGESGHGIFGRFSCWVSGDFFLVNEIL